MTSESTGETAKSEDFAIIESGGKQYCVYSGSIVRVEMLAGADGLDLKEGDEVVLDRVLLMRKAGTTTVGSPLVESSSVRAKVLGNDKDKKVVIFKKKRRKGYKLKKGHRQERTVLEIQAL